MNAPDRTGQFLTDEVSRLNGELSELYSEMHDYRALADECVREITKLKVRLIAKENELRRWEKA